MGATLSKLHVRDVFPVGGLTIKVSGVKGLLVRMYLAGLIFRFGALIAGTKLEMDIS